jgi:hypothetical protein
MTDPIRISFEPSRANDESPMVVLLNPIVLPGALLSQVKRFGLVGTADRTSALSGYLKGNRQAFTQMIQSYGVQIEIIRPGAQDGGYVPEPS